MLSAVKSITALLLCINAAVAVPMPYYAASAATSGQCSAVHIITVRGSTENQGTGTALPDGGQDVNPATTVGYEGNSGEGEMGLIAAAVQLSLIKSVSRAAAVYPALLDPYAPSVAAGEKNLLGQIQYQANLCPNQKLVLLGFSQGAQIVGDVLSGTGGSGSGVDFGAVNNNPPLDPTVYSKYIYAVILWGDPRHALGQPIIGGAIHSGFFPRNPTQSATLQQYYGSKLQSYCNFGDEYCGSGEDGQYAINVGNLTFSNYIHELSYPLTAAAPAVAFITSKVGII